jgi:hypothetical protein
MMESRPCDVLHTLAGSVLNGWTDVTPPQSPEDLYSIKHPLWLADFLLPGHETWAVYRYSEWVQYYNIKADPDRVIADMRRHAAMGFTPLMQAPGDIPPTTIDVANSWEETVPLDLQLPATRFPFGPVRDGSSSVALGTSAHPMKGGGNGPGVRGWKPTRPGASTAVPESGDAPVVVEPESGAASAEALSKKVAVRRAGPRPSPARPQTPPVSDDPGASEVRTFYGGASDHATVVLPPAPRPPPKKKD